MAFYRDERYVRKSPSPIFDGIQPPGSRARRSGIYRCVSCGLEVVSEKDSPLPPQDSHHHEIIQDEIRWELIVCAEHQADRNRQPG